MVAVNVVYPPPRWAVPRVKPEVPFKTARTCENCGSGFYDARPAFACPACWATVPRSLRDRYLAARELLVEARTSVPARLRRKHLRMVAAALEIQTWLSREVK